MRALSVLKFEGFRISWYSRTFPAVVCTEQERPMEDAEDIPLWL
jgi:hypothetical protein